MFDCLDFLPADGNGPSIGYCGMLSEPGASFGDCADHNEELLDGFYSDGASPRGRARGRRLTVPASPQPR